MKVQLSPQMKGEALIRTEPNLREGNVCNHRDGQPGSLLSDWRQKERGRTGKEVREKEMEWSPLGAGRGVLVT